jgi:hypothetical protein
MREIEREGSLYHNLVLSINRACTQSESVQNSVTQATLSSSYNFKDIALYDAGLTILFCLGIIGSFLILRNKLDEKNLTIEKYRISISNVTLIFIPLPYVMAIIYPQSLPARWFPFIETLTGILSGVTIYVLYCNLYKSRLNFLPHILIVILIFFMITSPVANPNSHIYSESLSNRNSLTQSEIDTANFTNKLVNVSKVHANSEYIQFINRSVLDYDHFVNPAVPETYDRGIILIRKDDIKKGFVIPLFGSKNKLLDIIPPNEEFNISMSNSHKIYENNQVKIYSHIGEIK